MASTTKSSGPGFSAEEKAAMKQRAAELKAEAARADGEAALRAAVDQLTGLDRELAERIVELVTAAAPELDQKTYYGFPAWAKNGKTIVFFKPASKFKTRYATLGFEDWAAIDDGTMFASSFGLYGITEADAKTITTLVKKAAGEVQPR